MKAYIITGLLAFGVSINVLLAQPLAVKKGLKQEFPAAKSIKWNKKHNLWNANFFIGNKKTSALFDLEGHWLYAQQEIKLEEIGVEEVKTAIKKDFSGCKSLSIIIINEASSGTWYEVTGTCGNEVRTRSYDYMGLPPPRIS